MNPPSIPEQIQTLEEQIEEQIAALRDSHAVRTTDGVDALGSAEVITDQKARRDIEAMECTVALLKRWIE